MSSDASPKDAIVSIRMTAAERHRMTAAAERHGMTSSEWARLTLLRHADDPAVKPSQNILIRCDPPVIPAAEVDEVRRWLARAPAAWKAGLA